jgi:hypothetical protein
MNKATQICLIIITTVVLIGAGIWYKRDKERRDAVISSNQVVQEVSSIEDRARQRTKIQTMYYDTAKSPNSDTLSAIWERQGLGAIN